MTEVNANTDQDACDHLRIIVIMILILEVTAELLKRL